MTLDLLETEPQTRAHTEAAIADAVSDHQAACERTVAGGRCTLCEEDSSELLPWSGERICWHCFDGQLNLMVKAIHEAAPGDHLVFGGDLPAAFEGARA